MTLYRVIPVVLAMLGLNATPTVMSICTPTGQMRQSTQSVYMNKENQTSYSHIQLMSIAVSLLARRASISSPHRRKY